VGGSQGVDVEVAGDGEGPGGHAGFDRVEIPYGQQCLLGEVFGLAGGACRGAAGSLPFFVATLPIAARDGIWGRVWLCGVATLNAVCVTWLLGEASWTALFLALCTMLALVSFRRREVCAAGAAGTDAWAADFAAAWEFPCPACAVFARRASRAAGAQRRFGCFGWSGDGLCF
jgi:hypothetical protein